MPGFYEALSYPKETQIPDNIQYLPSRNRVWRKRPEIKNTAIYRYINTL